MANVTQRPDECPGDFLERLYGAYGICTPPDPDSPDNQRTVSTAFGHSRPWSPEGNSRSLRALPERTQASQWRLRTRSAATGRKQREGGAEEDGEGSGPSGYGPRTPSTEQGRGKKKEGAGGHWGVERDRCACCAGRGHWERGARAGRKGPPSRKSREQLPVLSLAGWTRTEGGRAL